jgi:Protein of unknown function (DUF1800)
MNPFSIMPENINIKQKKLQHLYLRAGFGETPYYIHKTIEKPIEGHVSNLFVNSRTASRLSYLQNPLKGKTKAELSNRKILRKILKSREQVRKLNLAWLERMAKTKAVLREKMILFWHGHFATRSDFAYLMQIQNNTFRKQALGNFRDLLHAVAKDPAMLLFLNNQQNIKKSPNENFARELMELFTLGEGHYTEQDIKESARAFTGWQVNKRGEFEFNEQMHDFGKKRFFGKTGNFNGDDIIDIIMENRQVAYFISKKIYMEFVNEKPDEENIRLMADVFFESNYDISALMQYVFTADWFYDERNIGNKIISPFEMLVRYKKLLNLEFKDEKTALGFQYLLGQILFLPPNVAGWKGGRNWIDSATLMYRIQIPIQSYNLELYPVLQKKINWKVNWQRLSAFYTKKSAESLLDKIISDFIQSNPAQIDRDYLQSYANSDSNGMYVKSMIAAVMSLPEFQLI